MANMIQDAADLIYDAMQGKGQFTVKQAADKTKTWSVASNALGLLMGQDRAQRLRRGVYIIPSGGKDAEETDATFAARIAAFVYTSLGQDDALRLLELVERRVRTDEETEPGFALAEEISRHS